MSSVYISENGLAVTCYEHPFFPSLLISHDGLVGCNPLLTGCSRGSKSWGAKRGPREGQSTVRKWHSPGQGEASPCNSVALWREMDGRTPGVLGSIPSFFPCVAIAVVGNSVNWWQSVLKHQTYTEHLDMCCSSHFNLFNLLKQSTFLQCNQDIILHPTGPLGLSADIYLTLVKKCWWETVWVIK